MNRMPNKFEIIKKIKNHINPKYYKISSKMAHVFNDYKTIRDIIIHQLIENNIHKIHIIINENDDIKIILRIFECIIL
jgi:hypothetical protein